MPDRRFAGLKILAASVVLVGVSSCAVSGLAFKQDDRVQLVSPEVNEIVELPFEVEWTVEDAYEGRFALLIDRNPMRPGQPLLALVAERDPCRNRPDCPTSSWLADHHVYVTDETSVRITSLPDLRPNERSKDRHELVVVLLDQENRRIGEAAFVREFIVRREN